MEDYCGFCFRDGSMEGVCLESYPNQTSLGSDGGPCSAVPNEVIVLSVSFTSSNWINGADWCTGRDQREGGWIRLVSGLVPVSVRLDHSHRIGYLPAVLRAGYWSLRLQLHPPRLCRQKLIIWLFVGHWRNGSHAVDGEFRDLSIVGAEYVQQHRRIRQLVLQFLDVGLFSHFRRVPRTIRWIHLSIIAS